MNAVVLEWSVNWGGNALGDQKEEHSGDVRAAADVEAKQDVQTEREWEIAKRDAVESRLCSQQFTPGLVSCSALPVCPK